MDWRSRRMFALRCVFWSMLCLATLAACAKGNGSLGGGGGGGGVTPTASPAPTPTFVVVNVLPPSGTIYLGAFVNPAQVTPPPTSALTTFESQIGRTVAISPHYYGFYDAFPGPYEANDLANGRMPMDSWNCAVPDSSIVAGTQDTTITNRAIALKAYGKPIMLRYMWEMNVPSSATYRSQCYDPATDEPNGVFSPTEFSAAWNHMRQIFVNVGATNVVWVWSPSGVNNGVGYYPGGATVDWVGLDQYDTANVSFTQTYQAPYGWLAPLGKPMIIGETGAMAAMQPSFLGAAVSSLQTNYPQIKGYVYFDAGPVWSLSSAGLAAFTTMAADPYFSAAAP